MKLPEVLIWGDWACRNIAGLECPDPDNWYVLAARKQEYVCVCARTLAYDFTIRMQAVGAHCFWRRPAIAIGNRRWKSKSVRTARSDPLAIHQAAQVARNVPPEASAHQAPQPAPSARLGSTWVKEMEQS